MKLDSWKIKTRRLEMGMTQEDVGKMTGLHRVTVWNAEHGKSLYPRNARVLCAALGLKLAEAMLPLRRRKGQAA